MLSIGSFGQAVGYLQKALNLAPSYQAKLATDSQFGPKTRNRVLEFQGQKGLSKDGVVGPITWGQLEPFIQQLLGLVDAGSANQVQEQQIRDQIVAVALSSFDTWGWGEAGPVTPNGSSHRIAAAKGYGPYVAGRRARQGGASLALIAGMAKAGNASQWLTISKKAEEAYLSPPSPARTTILNGEGSPSWCGIFTAYCLRAAGLKVGWDEVSNQSSSCFTSLGYNDPVMKGDIGVYLKTKTGAVINHHYLVVQDSQPGQNVHSVDGNLGHPSESVVWEVNSVISKRKYLRSTLLAADSKFLRPKYLALK